MNLYTRVPDKGRLATSVSMNAPFNQTMGSSIANTTFWCERMHGFSLVLGITESVASLAGTLKLQASNNAYTDNTDLVSNPDAIWVDIPTSPVTLTAGSTQVLWNHTDVEYESVRIVWTSTSGQGTFLAYFLAKSKGG